MDLRVKKTHYNIQQALLVLLKQKSLEDISIAELCRIAEINRGTFYLHYKNVHAVFERYFNEIVDDLKTSYELPYDLTRDNISNITPEMIKIFHHVNKYEAFYRIVFDEKIPLNYYKMLFETIRSFIKSYHNHHLINLTDDELDFFLSFTANSIIGVILQWHNNDYKQSPKQLNEILMKLIKLKQFDLN
ncbi:TetR family transcriptional regulator C-terminal domain-containing protein [Solibacillus sp. MA9]|uniref:TetR family transcriptional regulator C-terminal domain-containing protein n=1 Tax=Solibacillus palustris TaxID=2908203 RepID=A0ABS9UBI5_9BACL|nr:TetR-like C-terminal domain-containing protein [Solibacillus sp. MA9]MCH7321687.1 TetR family transcriptional regulator C-terminal domain-containing protein [Solibacillus sp. MA9]